MLHFMSLQQHAVAHLLGAWVIVEARYLLQADNKHQTQAGGGIN
jgi:hypothetical protein